MKQYIYILYIYIYKMIHIKQPGLQWKVRDPGLFLFVAHVGFASCQPVGPPPQEIAGLMLRDYENPLVFLNKAGY